MHILYLHQYFVTRSGVGGTRSYEFARYLIEQGHQVTLITAADQSTVWAGKSMRRRMIDGITVVELKAGYADYQRGTAMAYSKRIWAFCRFALASAIAVLRLPRPDVVFATSTPLTIGLPGMLASAHHRAPLVFEVRDLWPEAPIQMGALRNPLAILCARWLERAIYRRSAHIVALSPGMRAGVMDAGIPGDRVSVIPNAADLDLFSPELDGRMIRERLGLDGKFICSYFGTMGETNDLSQVVEAARILQERQNHDIVFVLYGKGQRRSLLEAFCCKYRLTNVLFCDPIPKQDVAHLLAASDVAMTIFKNVPVLYTCSPNKLFDTLAAGRPAIVNTPGWLKDLVERHNCGVFVRPDDAEHLAEQVLFLRNHPEIVWAYGKNARRLAEQYFDRRKLGAQLLSIFTKVIENT